MGIRNAPFCFQSILSAILSRFTFRFALVYMDDILVYSSTVEDHFSNLESVFQLLHDANLKLKRSKCTTPFSDHVALDPLSVDTKPRLAL